MHTPASSDSIRDALKFKSLRAQQEFSQKHPTANSTLQKLGVQLGTLRQHSAKLLGASIVGGMLYLSPPTNGGLQAPSPHMFLAATPSESGSTHIPIAVPQTQFVDQLKKTLPDTPRPLSREEEKPLEQLIQKTTGVNARATLEGEHLNTIYGRIGAEQHLRRYPGDTITQHGDTAIQKEGIAPGLGAWGYFAPSKEAMTPQLEETEKWYAVVQTLYLPDWGKRQPYLKNWYKHRKVMIVNTDNGKSVIAAIADSGPAAWTGKHFGGSPEVMDYLGGDRYKKGPVLVLFVDDPNNTVPLGPVEYNKHNMPLGQI